MHLSQCQVLCVHRCAAMHVAVCINQAGHQRHAAQVQHSAVDRVGIGQLDCWQDIRDAAVINTDGVVRQPSRHVGVGNAISGDETWSTLLHGNLPCRSDICNALQSLPVVKRFVLKSDNHPLSDDHQVHEQMNGHTESCERSYELACRSLLDFYRQLCSPCRSVASNLVTPHRRKFQCQHPQMQSNHRTVESRHLSDHANSPLQLRSRPRADWRWKSLHNAP